MLWRPERIEERLDASTEMIEAAEAAGDREGMLQGRNWRVVDLMELGEREALDHEIAAYESSRTRSGSRTTAGTSRSGAPPSPSSKAAGPTPKRSAGRRSSSPPAPATRWRRG